jgi:hypothetical protein
MSRVINEERQRKRKRSKDEIKKTVPYRERRCEEEMK